MNGEKPSSSQIELLIAKALRGRLSEEEKVLLDRWYDDQENQEAAVYTKLSKEQFQEELFKRTLQRMQSPVGKKKPLVRRWLRIAASIVFALACMTWFYQYQARNTTPVQSAQALSDTYSSGPGVRKKLELPDGSVAYLNSNSQLLVYRDFSQERRVELTGEAFFDIKKNKGQAFVVETEGLITKVLGTSFSVSSHQVELEKVSVKTGKVRVEEKSQGTSVFLAPNQQGVFHKGELTKAEIKHPESVFGWTEGKLIFDKTPLQEIAPKLEAWYGVQVTVSVESDAPCQLTGTYTNLSLEELMELIRFSVNIDYKIDGKKLIIRAKGC
ncbi:FecR family protein [Pontibacter harenae]|uniref:FecR family protein n=1 Tax=Pontibacter harenae TaxID=2894083 RepID=UPI001E5953D8|nr:FecR domain-containing protein [Pontibacter harenae]MCC9167911.1 FecR domain-containing protein [Pontibacter harenae]